MRSLEITSYSVVADKTRNALENRTLISVQFA